LGAQSSIAVSLSNAAPPGGVTINFATDNSSIATVTPSVFIPQGQKVPASNPQVTGAGVGTAQITATSEGFAPDTVAVNVNVSIGFASNTLSVAEGATQTISVQSTSPAPAGGLTLNLTSVNTGVATVPASITIPQGQTTAQVPVSGVLAGTTNVKAKGTNTNEITLAVTVTQSPGMTINALTIGKDLQVATGGGLAQAAPAGNLEVTLTSDSPDVRLSTAKLTAGTSQIKFTIGAGSTSFPLFYVQALAATGTATITASAPGYRQSTALVTLRPSGLILTNPSVGLGGNVSTTTFAGNSNINVRLVRLTTTNGYGDAEQELRAGASPMSIAVTSADVSGTNVGSITASPVTIAPGASNATTQFDPANPGTARVSINTPAGFTKPTQYQSFDFIVTAPRVNVNAATIGKDLQVTGGVSLGDSAPAGGRIVTLTSNSPDVLLSKSRTSLGTQSLTFDVAAGNSGVGTFYIQSLASTGTATLTATADGYQTGTNTVTLRPSGFILSTHTTGVGGNVTTTTFSANFDVIVQPAVLTTAGTLDAYQELRAGLAPVSVNLTNTDVEGANIGALSGTSVIFNSTEITKKVQFDPANAGRARIGATAPTGFATPTTGASFLVIVNAPNISLGNVTIGKDLQVTHNASLAERAPVTTPMTITSDSPDVRLSASRTALGSQSLTFQIAAGGSSVPTFYVQSLAGAGTATLTASAPGYNTKTVAITLRASGFAVSTASSGIGGNVATTTFAANFAVKITPVMLTAQGQVDGIYELRAGFAPVQIAASVTDLAGSGVGSLLGNPVTIGANESEKTMQFDPQTAGRARVAITQPAGFTAPSVGSSFDVTVTAPPVSGIGNPAIGKDLQTALNLSLGIAPPAPVNVTVTISSGSIATVSRDATLEGTQTITFTNVNTTTVGTIYLQGRNIGTTTITVQAPGYTDATGHNHRQPVCLRPQHAAGRGTELHDDRRCRQRATDGHARDALSHDAQLRPRAEPARRLDPQHTRHEFQHRDGHDHRLTRHAAPEFERRGDPVRPEGGRHDDTQRHHSRRIHNPVKRSSGCRHSQPVNAARKTPQTETREALSQRSLPRRRFHQSARRTILDNQLSSAAPPPALANFLTASSVSISSTCFVIAQPQYARETQGVAALVAFGFLHAVKRNFENDFRLDRADAPVCELLNRVRFEPFGQFADLNIRESRICFADV
jgi:hypothetical protein